VKNCAANGCRESRPHVRARLDVAGTA
jgi:hypothetical protein